MLFRSSTDIEVVSIIKDLSEDLLKKIGDCKIYNNEFDNLFPQIGQKIITLRGYLSRVTGDNYKDQAEKFIEEYMQFKEAATDIQKVLKFCETDLNNVKAYKKFASEIVQELGKLGGIYEGNCIFSFSEQFEEKYTQSISDNFMKLKELFQKIKDEYYRIIEKEHQKMTRKHEELKNQAEESRKNVSSIPGNLNKELLNKIGEIKGYADKHICNHLEISFETKCDTCHYSLNEIISANQNVNHKIKELEETKIQIIYPDSKNTPKEVRRSESVV